MFIVIGQLNFVEGNGNNVLIENNQGRSVERKKKKRRKECDKLENAMICLGRYGGINGEQLTEWRVRDIELVGFWLSGGWR